MRPSSSRRLADSGAAYVLQDNSVFPDMTVEENLIMGGFLLDRRAATKQAAERVAGPGNQNRRHRIASRKENTSHSTDAVFKSDSSEYLRLLSIRAKFA